MGNLVGHHASQLRFCICGSDQTSIDIKEAPRESEGIDFVGVHDLDGEGYLGIGVSNEILANPVHIFVHLRVGYQLDLSLNLHG